MYRYLSARAKSDRRASIGLKVGSRSRNSRSRRAKGRARYPGMKHSDTTAASKPVASGAGISVSGPILPM
jgi:hypothetical protein